MEAAVRAWSRALNAGDNDAVARLFALPAMISQGDRIGQFDTYADIARFTRAFPCSGTVVDVTFETDEAVAVFELGDRGDDVLRRRARRHGQRPDSCFAAGRSSPGSRSVPAALPEEAPLRRRRLPRRLPFWRVQPSGSRR